MAENVTITRLNPVLPISAHIFNLPFDSWIGGDDKKLQEQTTTDS